MKKIVHSLLVCFAATSYAADAEKPKAITVNAPGGATVEIIPPAGWTEQKAQPQPPASTVSLSSANGNTTMLISFIPDKSGALGSHEKLEAILKQTAQQYVEGSVEKKITIQKLESKNGACVFAEFTDADLVGTKPEAGQFKVIGTGLMLFGDTVATITVLGDSFTDESYLAGKKTIKSGIKVRK